MVRDIYVEEKRISDSILPLPANSQPQHASIPHRNDIQGLRAIAIAAVLLFHTWEKTFSNGYLGVDVFFVISGFLMCSILSRAKKLSMETLSEFYFRRAKRIVPLYLFIIIAVLFFSIWIVDPFEYPQLLFETIPSMLFVSNYPPLHTLSYFDLRTANFLFKHTWSLSTELQFYLIVPFIFFSQRFLNSFHGIFAQIFLFYLAFLSFYRQTFGYITEQGRHFAPDGRVWQFLGGFIAFHVSKWGIFDYLKSAEKEDPFLGSVKCAIRKLASLFGIAILLTTLFYGIGLEQQITRIIVVVITGFLLAYIPHESDWLLGWHPIIRLGDVSYSIYLVHWPLFIFHRIANPETYDLDYINGTETPLKCREIIQTSNFSVGSFLIMFSVILGFVVEESFKRLLKLIQSWTFLASTLAAKYSLIITLILYFFSNQMIMFDAGKMTPEWHQNMMSDVVALYETHDVHPDISRDESLRLNGQLARFNAMLGSCWNTTDVPTDFPMNYQVNTYACRDRGAGSKNIVIIGNSHSIFTHAGVKYHFAEMYDHLDLFAGTACMLATPEQQIPFVKEMCGHYIREVVPALRKWKYPIDVIMVFFGYARFPDWPIESDVMEEDPQFRTMSDLLANLTDIAQEVVLMSNMSIHYKEDPLRSAMRRLHRKKPLDRIGTTKTEQMAYLPQTRERYRHLHCSDKCIPVDLLKFCTFIPLTKSFTVYLNYDNFENVELDISFGSLVEKRQSLVIQVGNLSLYYNGRFSLDPEFSFTEAKTNKTVFVPKYANSLGVNSSASVATVTGNFSSLPDRSWYLLNVTMLGNDDRLPSDMKIIVKRTAGAGNLTSILIPHYLYEFITAEFLERQLTMDPYPEDYTNFFVYLIGCLLALIMALVFGCIAIIIIVDRTEIGTG